MSKVKPMALVESMSGKVCSHSDMYFRTNKRNGNVSTGKICYPYTGTPTSNQTAARSLFASAVAKAKAILAATSSDTDQSNFTKQTNYKAQYAADRKFPGTLYNFIMKKEYAVLQNA